MVLNLFLFFEDSLLILLNPNVNGDVCFVWPSVVCFLPIIHINLCKRKSRHKYQIRNYTCGESSNENFILEPYSKYYDVNDKSDESIKKA